MLKQTEKKKIPASMPGFSFLIDLKRRLCYNDVMNSFNQLNFDFLNRFEIDYFDIVCRIAKFHNLDIVKTIGSTDEGFSISLKNKHGLSYFISDYKKDMNECFKNIVDSYMNEKTIDSLYYDTYVKTPPRIKASSVYELKIRLDVIGE